MTNLEVMVTETLESVRERMIAADRALCKELGIRRVEVRLNDVVLFDPIVSARVFNRVSSGDVEETTTLLEWCAAYAAWTDWLEG